MQCVNKKAKEAAPRTRKYSITIAGGHRVADKKSIVTPLGVATYVDDEQAKMLLAHDGFKRHMKRGFMRIEEEEWKPSEVAKDMETEDKSTPLTPEKLEQEFKDQQKEGAKLPEVGKVASK